MKKNLFEEESDNENDEIQLKTNEGYAKSYNEFRKKELLSHRKFFLIISTCVPSVN